MTPIRKRKVKGNEIWWLAEGHGAHGESPRNTEDVATSLRGRFVFAEETDEQPGLRRPQLGALHAILAQRTLETNEPITIVMPTGTRQDRNDAGDFRAFARTDPRRRAKRRAAYSNWNEVRYSGDSSFSEGAAGGVSMSCRWPDQVGHKGRRKNATSCLTPATSWCQQRLQLLQVPMRHSPG